MVKKSSRRTKRDVRRTKRYVRRSKRDVRRSKRNVRRSKRDFRRSKRNVRRTKRLMRGGMDGMKRLSHGRTVHIGDDEDFQRILAMAEEESRKAEQERLERVRELERKKNDDIIDKAIKDGVPINVIAYSNKGNDKLLQRLALRVLRAEQKFIDDEAKENMEIVLKLSEKNPELLTDLVKSGVYDVERPDPTKLLAEILTDLKNTPNPDKKLGSYNESDDEVLKELKRMTD